MLNTDKTEVMIVGTASRIKQVASNSITILNSDIKIQESVKYLGVRLDQTLSMSSHISDVCRSSFLSLRRIGSQCNLSINKSFCVQLWLANQQP